MRHVILDTDIGTDVDHLLALVFIGKAPKLCLEGVTTVHGDTLLRAKVARIACQKLGIPDLSYCSRDGRNTLRAKAIWPGHVQISREYRMPALTRAFPHSNSYVVR
jgi:purine nucleosidase